ncbi:MAG TPA: excinuclease ABC subunit UvrC [Myxococcota bacterium]|nr:excinuclease ABC subunit UvrC [Myxococcota bacterium]
MSLAERAEGLPAQPGVYLFKNERGKVLYVGKAQNLRARVRQYVVGGDGRVRMPPLLARAVDVDVVVTPSVKDALLLENELIKRHKPPFNVKLRDDKQYLALRLDPREPWPRLREVRRFQDDGADYFGPFTSSVAMHEAVSRLRRIFPLRSCREGVFKDHARRGRPCIEFEMKRCLAPCVGLVTPEAYAELARGTALFLRGRSDELTRELERRMQGASEAMRFEEAARLRDQLTAVERTVERQQIVTERRSDRDVFGVSRRGGDVDVCVLHVREGRVVGTEGYALAGVAVDDGELMGSLLGQYYDTGAGRAIPREVLTSVPADDAGALAAWLGERAERRVAVRAPSRGPARDLLAMADTNAELSLTRRLEARESVEAALTELQERLGLSRLPRRIEGYDISTLHGTLTVGSRVAFENGRPDKSGYRRYRIREADPGDDYAALREVIRRRVGRRESEPLPDLLLIDGGKGQLAVACAVLADTGIEQDVVSLAKERDLSSPSLRVRRSGGLKAERIFLPGRKDPVSLPSSSRALLVLQRVRDESHRFAIEFQRSLRSRAHLSSILEELPGIGPGKRAALLKRLGSLKGVREASEETLRSVPGISARDAATLRRFFDAARAESAAAGSESEAGPSSDAAGGETPEAEVVEATAPAGGS